VLNKERAIDSKSWTTKAPMPTATKMTLDVYAHAVPTLQRESAEKMDSPLNAIGDTSRRTREVQRA
jgi:hypothetical protein